MTPTSVTVLLSFWWEILDYPQTITSLLPTNEWSSGHEQQANQADSRKKQ